MAIRREVCDSETVAENPVPQKSQSELLDKISFSQMQLSFQREVAESYKAKQELSSSAANMTTSHTEMD